MARKTRIVNSTEKPEFGPVIPSIEGGIRLLKKYKSLDGILHQKESIVSLPSDETNRLIELNLAVKI